MASDGIIRLDVADICGDRRCVDPKCRRARTSLLFIYLARNHSHPRLPLIWNAPIELSFFSLAMHEHLAHLARAHCERYERYQVGQGWDYVDVQSHMPVLEGQFIILRPLNVTDRSCAGLSSLIRRLHRRWDTANLTMSTIPERYRRDAEVAQNERDETRQRDGAGDGNEADEEDDAEEEGYSDTSESSGGDDMWAEEFY